MRTYNQIEIDMGQYLSEPSSTYTDWVDFTQERRRIAIKDAELYLAETIRATKLLKLQTEPINLTALISGNILTFPIEYLRLFSLWHQPSTGNNVYIHPKDQEWHELQDNLSFNYELDPYWYDYGNKKIEIKHGITSPSWYGKFIKYPQTYEPSFDFGDQYSELDGYEQLITIYASALLLLAAKEFDNAANLFKMCDARIQIINNG